MQTKQEIKAGLVSVNILFIWKQYFRFDKELLMEGVLIERKSSRGGGCVSKSGRGLFGNYGSQRIKFLLQ